jgi:hypothetical protein
MTAKVAITADNYPLVILCDPNHPGVMHRARLLAWHINPDDEMYGCIQYTAAADETVHVSSVGDMARWIGGDSGPLAGYGLLRAIGLHYGLIGGAR